MEPQGTALVTGAGRGIGRAVALELAARGFEVVATMRRPATAADLPERAAERGGKLRVEALDVTAPETIRVPAGLRVLVNNAGLDAPYLPVEHAPLTLWRELFDTNLFGLVEVTRRAIPALREAGGGVICNVSSCSILVPMPFFAAYRASKAAVSALGESLRTEVRPFGIRVLEVQPGAIGTDMLAESERLPEAAEHADYRAMAERVHASRRAASGQVTSAEDAARAIAGAILDDASPLRVACDPMGAGLLETWRASSDEEMMSGMLAHFAPRQA